MAKIIQTSDYSIIEDNMLTVAHFHGYEDEFNFITEHREKYGNVPDETTFIDKFPVYKKDGLPLVNEPDRYLVDTIQEEYQYEVAVPIVNRYAELLGQDANAANEYLASNMHLLQPNYSIGGTDIIHSADSRYEEHLSRRENQKDWYFESGFPELDDIIHGIQRGEEFIVLVARLGQGKSFVLTKMCAHTWKTGFNVGYVSPEMSANMIGFRFDTLLKNFSNKNLMYGKDEAEYEEYIAELKNKKNKFMVATPADFNRKITVSKLRSWVKQNSLDLLAIDGIKYLSDERGSKNDNLTTSLTNISEDLMELSVEMKIPVLVVVQANRTGASGAEEDGTPELESIRDSDGIAHNATKVIALKQKADDVLEMGVKKNRTGKLGSVNYIWSKDTGEFTYTETRKSSRRSEPRNDDNRRKLNDSKNVF